MSETETPPTHSEELPQELRDEIGDVIVEVFAKRINLGVAGGHEPVGRVRLLESPSDMRFAHECATAVCAVLDRWGVREA